MSPLTQQWSKSSSICSLCTGASWKIQVSSLPRASWSRFSWQLFSPAHPFCIATDRPAAYTKLLSPFDEEVDKTPVIRSVMLKLLLKYRWAESVIGCNREEVVVHLFPWHHQTSISSPCFPTACWICTMTGEIHPAPLHQSCRWADLHVPCVMCLISLCQHIPICS